MRDRVPTYPGRIVLTPVAGQENTFDLTRADAPMPGYEGTPLNKANLLTDATATALGLNPANNPSPDDALKQIPNIVSKHALKVGDVLITDRTDLGEKWLLCNGAAIDPATYPDLSALLKANPFGTGWTRAATTANLMDLCY